MGLQKTSPAHAVEFILGMTISTRISAKLSIERGASAGLEWAGAGGQMASRCQNSIPHGNSPGYSTWKTSRRNNSHFALRRYKVKKSPSPNSTQVRVRGLQRRSAILLGQTTLQLHKKSPVDTGLRFKHNRVEDTGLEPVTFRLPA
jgi:hypothetical protein